MKEFDRRDFIKGAILTVGGIEVVRQQLWTPRSAEAKPLLDGQVGFVRASGFPEKPFGTVEMADGVNFRYQNANWRSHFAEPGALLVGPEFPEAELRRGGGFIQRINPVTQNLIFDTEGGIIGPEGGITVTTVGGARVEFLGNDINPMVLDLIYAGRDDHMHMLVIRWLYPAEGDRNRVMRLSNLVPGANQTMRYIPPRGKNVAYASEGQGLQMLQDAGHFDQYSTNNNCGDSTIDQCALMTVTLVDANTKGWRVVGNITPSSLYGQVLGGNY